MHFHRVNHIKSLRHNHDQKHFWYKKNTGYKLREKYATEKVFVFINPFSFLTRVGLSNEKIICLLNTELDKIFHKGDKLFSIIKKQNF